MRLSNVSKRCKLLALGAAAVLSLGLMAGCGSSDQSASSGSGKNYKIGIVQLVEHNALDAANKGFVDGLKERGFEEGKNITIDRQNAQADQSNLQNIAQRFVSAKMDLICAIATPAAQTMANATHDIPIVGTAITDYEGAKLVASNKEPKGNVTGTSDMNPVKEQIDLLLKSKFRPEFLNRLDEIVYYKSLTKDEMRKIVDLQLNDLRKRMDEGKHLKLEVTTAAKDFIIDSAYDSVYGARPIKRFIQSRVETLIAKAIIQGSYAEGNTLTVDCENGTLVLR